MRYALLAACAAILFAPTQANARTREPIKIEANLPTIQSWTAQVSQALNTNLRYPQYIGLQEPETGYAFVSFRVGEDGRPVGVSLERSSGSARLDRAALSAVNGMDEIAPMPHGVPSFSRVQANISFASDEVTAERLARQIEREMVRMARAPGHADELALIIGSNVTAG